MARFEDRLWTELVEQHGALLAEPPAVHAPVEAPARRFRRARVAAVALAVAAALVALVIGLGRGGGGTSAYAVVTHPDGTVTVTINELVGVEPANQRLEELGLPVRVVAQRPGCPTRASEVHPAHLSPDQARQIFEPVGGPGRRSVRIDPAPIPPGDTLMLRADERRPGLVALGALVIEGQAPPCLPPGPGE